MAGRAYRLPTSVQPRRYDIHLQARIGDPTFRGTVGIDLDVLEPVRAIEIHARDITIRSARLETGGKTVDATPEPDAEVEMVKLALPAEIGAGSARLTIEYDGVVQKNMEGLYLSKDGEEQCLSTQCEETDARAIFPCFDEPAFKARFATTVTTTSDVTVLANGPLDKVEDGPAKGERTWRFHPTKPMSSYLFATTIGRLASSEEKHVAGVPMRVWAMEGKEHLGAFGNDFASRLLPYYNDYFGVPYHFDKYDQVGVPSFSAGAMENSGLVIFRQAYLLHDERTTSWRQERLIARVIAHEFAHMWFGNLVTMAWWDDIWLNEAFAEWMANKATDAMRPDYRIWDDFQSEKAMALVSDALESTHSIYSPVATPEEATELFDAITYEKGAAVMRMLENFLGEDAFRDGLRSYMREFSEGNAAGADLWRHLAKASGRPVHDIMSSWITQPGHPIVSVSLSDGKLRLKQRRFFSAPAAPASDQTWFVPLVIRYEDDAGVHEKRVLLQERDATVPFETNGEVKWLDANADAIGFYRQDLDDALMPKLVANLGKLESATLTGLLDDQWGLVRNGEGPMARFLDTLHAVAEVATTHAVLDRVNVYFGEVEDLLKESDAGDALEAFRARVRNVLAPRIAEVGWASKPGEPKSTGEIRRTLLWGAAALGEDADAIATARSIAEKEERAPTNVDPDIAGVAVAITARFGDKARLDKHFGIYDTRRAAKASPAETSRYLQSMPHFRDEAAIAHLIALIEDGRFPLEANGPTLRAMLNTRHGRVAAWEHMMRKWDDVRGKLGDMWTGMLVENTGNLPASRREELVGFYAQNLGNVAQQAKARAIERLDQREEFEARVTPDVVRWYRKVAA